MVTAGVLSASGLQKTGNETIVVSIFGLLGGALTAFHTFQISEHLDSLRGGLLNPQLGIGIYVAFGGAALLFIGALMAPKVPSAKKKKAPKSPPGAPS